MAQIIKNILVTGGTGFIGSHTSIALLNKGYRLIIIDSLINSYENVIYKISTISKIKCNKEKKSQIVFIKGDIRDHNFIESVFKRHTNNQEKIEAVIHFAGLKSVNESIIMPIKYWDNNVKGTINLLKIMEEFNCFNFVFSSSATIYGNILNNQLIKENYKISPQNPYGQTKAVIEKILENLSLVDNNKWRIVILRYFNPIGAHESGLIGENPLNLPNNIAPLIYKVASRELKELQIFGNDWDTIDGTGVRDYIHVMDLAEGHLCALEYILNNKTKFIQINLGTGYGTSVLQLIKTFEKVNNLEIPYKFVSRRQGDISYSVADNSLARLKLNWIPKRNLSKMCSDGWRWYMSNKSNY